MSSPSSSPLRRRSRSRVLLRRCERACCAVATYFPLAFVYSLTTWAVYVEASIGLTHPGQGRRRHFVDKPFFSLVGIGLYLLLNTSYTIAVFTDPGSPTADGNPKKSGKHGYSYLPTTEPSQNQYIPSAQNSMQAITVSSTGSPRYCKKCSTQKPDRTHHCSTCRRCVLKMDHHCPWLATCVGFRNYKAFLLFLIYTCLFCYVCFLVGGVWAWTEILREDVYDVGEEMAAMPAQVILLAVISGIIGLVLSGFTGWHIYLAARNQTTIEALEKTRYLDPMRKAVARTQEDQHHLLQLSSDDPIENLNSTIHRATTSLLTTHANAIPGATRVEEGEEHSSPTLSNPIPVSQPQPHPSPSASPSPSPAASSLSRHLQPSSDHRNHQHGQSAYAALEADQERARYESYLSEQQSEKLSSSLPNAFDLGLRANLQHLFGPNPWLWWLPVCNTTGDGWRWPVSRKWRVAREELERQRKAEGERERERGFEQAQGQGQYYYEHQQDHQAHPGRQVYPGQLRGGAGAGAADGVSLKTLRHQRSPSRTRRSRTRTRRDWDGRGADAESFEVSSDSSSDSDSESFGHHGWV